VYIDLTAAAAGVGTDLLASSGSVDSTARATASAAFDKANAANIIAEVANANSKLAFAQANVATVIAQVANANSQLAFAQANAALTVANVANANSKLAFSAANTAQYTANLAFDKANTSGGYYQGNGGDKGASNYGDIFRSHSNTLTASVTIYSGNNSLAAGPITVQAGQTIIIQTGARVVIV